MARQFWTGAKVVSILIVAGFFLGLPIYVSGVKWITEMLPSNPEALAISVGLIIFFGLAFEYVLRKIR